MISSSSAYRNLQGKEGSSNSNCRSCLDTSLHFAESIDVRVDRLSSQQIWSFSVLKRIVCIDLAAL